MKTILFCRHGESSANEAGIVAGTLDVELTGRGIRDAQALGEKLLSTPLDHVVTSCLVRAVETARPIADTHGMEFECWEDLHEVCFGEGEGGPKLIEGEASALEKLGAGTLPGAETLLELEDRAERCWRQLEQLPGNRICVVGHASFTAIMFAVRESIRREGFIAYRQSFDFGNGEVKEVSL